jgi:hypothetical protein
MPDPHSLVEWIAKEEEGSLGCSMLNRPDFLLLLLLHMGELWGLYHILSLQGWCRNQKQVLGF